MMGITVWLIRMNVGFSGRVMLRTMSTSRNGVTDIAAGAAFHRGNCSFERLNAGDLFAEVAKIAPEAEIDA